VTRSARPRRAPLRTCREDHSRRWSGPWQSCTESGPYILTPIARPEDLRWHRQSTKDGDSQAYACGYTTCAQLLIVADARHASAADTGTQELVGFTTGGKMLQEAALLFQQNRLDRREATLSNCLANEPRQLRCLALFEGRRAPAGQVQRGGRQLRRALRPNSAMACGPDPSVRSSVLCLLNYRAQETPETLFAPHHARYRRLVLGNRRARNAANFG